MGGVISGKKNPAVPFPLQNKEAGKIKANINLIKIITGFNKIKKEIKTLREVIFSFT